MTGVISANEPSDRGPPDTGTVRAAFVDVVRTIDTPIGDPVAAEMVTDIDIGDGILSVHLDLSTVDSDIANRVCDQITGVGLAFDGVQHVRLESAAQGRTGGEVTPGGADSIVAVCGAKGGVGKSTLTVALARSLTETGVDVGIFDADVETPDVSAFLGIEEPVTATPTGNPKPVRAEDIEVVGVDRVAGDRPTAWRGAMVHDVVADLLGNAAWSDRDVLLLDLPSGLGDVASTIFQRVPLDGALLVTTGTEASHRHTERTASLLEAHGVATAAIVENEVSDTGQESLAPSAVHRLVDLCNDDPAHVTVPFDPGFRQPKAIGTGVIGRDAEVALKSLADILSAFLAEADQDLLDDAVDLSGLPKRFRERQAILEFASAPDGPRPLVSANADKGELVDLLADEFNREIPAIELDDGRQLVRPGV